VAFYRAVRYLRQIRDKLTGPVICLSEIRDKLCGPAPEGNPTPKADSPEA
jgi:hypothetical protein